MKYQIVCVYDMVAESYAQPQFVASVGGWLRAFADEINRNDPQNQLFKHPKDFAAYLMGTYDDQTGRFDVLDMPERLATGANLVRSE